MGLMNQERKERKMDSSLILIPLLLCFSTVKAATATAYPLSTSGRWIVDAGSGKRVKLACVNWPSHIEPMVAEGLSKRPLDEISKAIRAMGFNCVRFTWPTFLATNDSLSNLTVRQSFERLGLNLTDVALIEHYNPTLIDLPLIEAYQAVVSNLADNNVMVILDNHVSKPGWCCSLTDGNGFFGDTYFDPNVWLEGLNKMATLFKSHKNVIGMSLRNELRGPRENVEDWFRYVKMGAETVHAANQDVLVIVSGLNFDTDLSFLSTRPLNVSFSQKRKLVFEVHWYSFSDREAWNSSNSNDVCGRISRRVFHKAGFLHRKFPLFLGEFGLDQRGVNAADNRFFSCAMAYAAANDLDWALWALQGSYYVRQGVVDLDETYGLLSFNWNTVRNQTQLQKFQSIQQPFRGPGFSEVPRYKIIFHPLTGRCVTLDSSRRLALAVGPCSQRWNYGRDKTLSLTTAGSTPSCIAAVGVGVPVALAECDDPRSSKWSLLSSSRMHVSTRVAGENATVCLDVGGDDGWRVVTNSCRCLSRDGSCDPEGQWFKLVTSTRLIS